MKHRLLKLGVLLNWASQIWSTLAIMGFLVTTGSGCKSAPRSHHGEKNPIHAREDVAVTSEQLRILMRALVEPLSGQIIQAADRISAETTDPAVKREALLWKIEGVAALRESLFRPDPLVALTDAWVLTWQMSDYFESGPGQKALGAAAPIAINTCQQMDAEISSIANSLVKSGDVSDARSFWQRWAREHPIRYSIGSRESVLTRAAERDLPQELSMQEVAGDVVATLDDLSRRMGVYSTQLLDEVRWQAELVTMDMASEYQLQKAMPLAEDAVHSARDAVTILNRLEPDIRGALAVANSAPEAIGRERNAAQQYISEERKAALESFSQEREAFQQHITREREAALTDMRQSIAAERKAVLDGTEALGARLIDHAIVRVTKVSAAMVVSIFVGTIILLLIARRLFRP